MKEVKLLVRVEFLTSHFKSFHSIGHALQVPYYMFNPGNATAGQGIRLGMRELARSFLILLWLLLGRTISPVRGPK